MSDDNTNGAERRVSVPGEVMANIASDLDRPEPRVSASHYFAQIPEALLYDPALSAEAVRVFGVLHRHAGPGGCFPSHARIAELIGRSKRSIRGWVKELEDAGWVDVVRRTTDQGDPDSNGYHLQMVLVGGGVRASQRGGVRASQRGGVRARERGGYALGSAPNESNGNQSNGNQGLLSPSGDLVSEPLTLVTVSAGPQADDGFDAFWSVYPRHVAKPKARQAWAKAVARATGDRIVRGAARYRDDPNREDRYTAHPATWLNQDRWDDDPLPAHTNGNGHAPVNLPAEAFPGGRG